MKSLFTLLVSLAFAASSMGGQSPSVKFPDDKQKESFETRADLGHHAADSLKDSTGVKPTEADCIKAVAELNLDIIRGSFAAEKCLALGHPAPQLLCVAATMAPSIISAAQMVSTCKAATPSAPPPNTASNSQKQSASPPSTPPAPSKDHPSQALGEHSGPKEPISRPRSEPISRPRSEPISRPRSEPVVTPDAGPRVIPNVRNGFVKGQFNLTE
jgi:hypothetical protein